MEFIDIQYKRHVYSSVIIIDPPLNHTEVDRFNVTHSCMDMLRYSKGCKVKYEHPIHKQLEFWELAYDIFVTVPDIHEIISGCVRLIMVLWRHNKTQSYFLTCDLYYSSRTKPVRLQTPDQKYILEFSNFVTNDTKTPVKIKRTTDEILNEFCLPVEMDHPNCEESFMVFLRILHFLCTMGSIYLNVRTVVELCKIFFCAKKCSLSFENGKPSNIIMYYS